MYSSLITSNNCFDQSQVASVISKAIIGNDRVCLYSFLNGFYLALYKEMFSLKEYISTKGNDLFMPSAAILSQALLKLHIDNAIYIVSSSPNEAVYCIHIYLL
jgi:hypothetical protein